MSQMRSAGQRGISLVELLVGMVILALVTTGMVMVWIVLQDSYSFSTRSSEQREAARDTVTLLARELRDVQPLALGSTTPPIVVAQPYSISFYTTFHNKDAESPEADVQLVDYEIRSDEQKPDVDVLARRIDGGPWQTVVSDVRNRQNDVPLFGYTHFLEDGSLPTTPLTAVDPQFTDRIVNIRIQLIVDVNPGKSPSEMRLTTTVQPRNLRSS